jgi:hypothetical protein
MAEDDGNKRRVKVLRVTYDGSDAGSMEAFELALKSAFPTGTKVCWMAGNGTIWRVQCIVRYCLELDQEVEGQRREAAHECA